MMRMRRLLFFAHPHLFAQPHVPTIYDVTIMSKNPFIEAYMKSIQPARDILSGYWSECIRDEKS